MFTQNKIKSFHSLSSLFYTLVSLLSFLSLSLDRWQKIADEEEEKRSRRVSVTKLGGDRRRWRREKTGRKSEREEQRSWKSGRGERSSSDGKFSAAREEIARQREREREREKRKSARERLRCRGRDREVEEEQISSSSSLLRAHTREWRGASLATEKFPSREREGERGALEREEREGKQKGIISGKREREGEREREKRRRNGRNSSRDGNNFRRETNRARVRAREQERKGEKRERRNGIRREREGEEG